MSFPTFFEFDLIAALVAVFKSLSPLGIIWGSLLGLWIVCVSSYLGVRYVGKYTFLAWHGVNGLFEKAIKALWSRNFLLLPQIIALGVFFTYIFIVPGFIAAFVLSFFPALTEGFLPLVVIVPLTLVGLADIAWHWAQPDTRFWPKWANFKFEEERLQKIIAEKKAQELLETARKETLEQIAREESEKSAKQALINSAKLYRATIGNLNLWSEPNDQSASLLNLSANDRVLLVLTEDKQGKFTRVYAVGLDQYGWISARRLEEVDPSLGEKLSVNTLSLSAILGENLPVLEPVIES